MLGAFIGRALAAAGKTVVAAAVNVAANELRKPETQRKIGASVDAVTHALGDPEKRKELERTAGAVRDSAARALGRAAGTLRNRLGSGEPDD